MRGVKVLVGVLSMCALSWSAVAEQGDVNQLTQQVRALQDQAKRLENRIEALKLPPARSMPQKALKNPPKSYKPYIQTAKTTGKEPFHNGVVEVHVPDQHPESLEFYPTVLLADNQVVTHIAGTPVITAPYLGARPAFDGSDYIVNISSINRDIRLMQQRRNLYRSFNAIGYPPPDMPILALSGKIEPVISVGRSYVNKLTGDLTLGSDELDVAAVLTDNMEAYMGIAYNSAPPVTGGQRVANSSFSLNMGFVNIGNLDKTPYYMTLGQIYAPFGRYSSAMISPTLPMIMARTKSRPLILGYKSREKTGNIISGYGFKSDTTAGQSGVGGINWAYIFEVPRGSGEMGVGFISSIDDATGMQYTGSQPGTTFGGFASRYNGSENVRKTPAVDVHANLSVDRYNLIFEWLSVTKPFRSQDLSFNGIGAKPQAIQGELGMTFHLFDKPASIGAGYQWTSQALALNLPLSRVSAVFNLSYWKDTIESIEYRHDTDYGGMQYANGANAPGLPSNLNTVGTGKSSDTVIGQIGVFF